MTPEDLAATASEALDAVTARLNASGDPGLQVFADDLAMIDRSHVQRGPLPRLDHPAMAHLDTALAQGQGDAFGEAMARAAGALDWGQVYQDATVGVGVAEGMLAAQMAGTYGVFASGNVAAGLFLLGPGVFYPEHTHAAEELYLCLSGTLTLEHGLDGAPFTIDPGGYSVTPPHRLHTLKTGDDPVLLLYVWRGDLLGPIWVWERAGEAWQRVQWHRPPGGSWARLDSEAVDAAILAEALGKETP